MEQDYIRALARQNPWWGGSIAGDQHYARWLAEGRRWEPFSLPRLSLEPFSLNIVVGPRQAGKTTLMKIAIAGLLERGVPPKSILYARCDEVASTAILREIVESFLSYSQQKEKFLFLDEITGIEGWEKTLKGFVDDGDFAHAAVTVGGSNALQLQRGAELFPGRRGKGNDIRVLPLTFRQYLLVRAPKLAGFVPPLKTISGLKAELFAPLMGALPSIQGHFRDYMECGGFPLALLSYVHEGRVSETAKDAYRSWVVGDMLKAGKSDVVAREVMKVVISKMPSALSWEGIAQETSIRSAPTVASYVELLERLFVLLPLYCIDPNTGTREFAKNKKLHLIDPFLLHLFEEWCMQPVERKGELMAESCLAAHIARFLSEKQGGSRLGEHVSYWKNGSEVDVVAHTKEGIYGFEMKWSGREKSFPVKIGPIKRVAYVSSGLLRGGRQPVYPLALLLAML